MTLDPGEPVVKLFLFPQIAFEPPLNSTLHSFQRGCAHSAGAVDEAVSGIAIGGCEGWGLIDAARLLASVWLVIGPSLGRILFSLTTPLNPEASTRFVTRDGNGICLLSVKDYRKSLITHHMSKA